MKPDNEQFKKDIATAECFVVWFSVCAVVFTLAHIGYMLWSM